MAFGLENRGVEPEYIGKRIKNTINELDIEKLEDRNVFSMSDGEKQLLAFASVYSGDYRKFRRRSTSGLQSFV